MVRVSSPAVSPFDSALPKPPGGSALTGGVKSSAVPVLHGSEVLQLPKKESLKDARGLWITTEFWHPSLPDKLKKGGLAQVASTIPWQLHRRGMDLRPIFPYYAALHEQGFKKASASPVVIPGVNGDDDDVYQLYYKIIDGVTCYAIDNPRFSQYNDLYSADKEDPEPLYITPTDDGIVTQHSGGQPVVQHSGGMPVQTSGGAPTPPKAVNKTIFKFNQAVAAYMPMLNPTASEKHPPEWQFKNDANVNFFNDWLSGVVLSELKSRHPEYLDKTSSIFFVHNVYDTQTMPFSLAEKLGLSIPEELKSEFIKRVENDGLEKTTSSNWFNRVFGKMFGGNDKAEQAETFNRHAWGMSPLSYGLRFSDLVVMNQRFKETNLDTTFMKDAPFVRFLRDKDHQGLVFDMHHAVSDDHDPTKDPVLQTDGFTTLHPGIGQPDNVTNLGADALPALNPVKDKALQGDGYTHLNTEVTPSATDKLKNNLKDVGEKALAFLPEDKRPKAKSLKELQREADITELKRYKAQNKAALQKEFGLQGDPDAVIYGMLVRANDPRQKGIFRLVNTIEKFMYEHPHAQFVLGGGFNEKNDYPYIVSLVKSLKNNPDLQNRICCYPEAFIPQQRSKRLMAGASFIMTPSSYEPYGLSQIEPMKYGTPPVASQRDGLFSTVYDPYVLPAYNPDPSDRNKASYGQTGYMMDEKSDNMGYIARQDSGNWKPTDPEIRASNEAFYQVMHRSYEEALSGRSLETGLNGMAYARAEHNADKITDLYEPVIQKALALKQSQPSGLEAEA